MLKAFKIYFTIFLCAGLGVPVAAYSQESDNKELIKEYYLRGNILYQQGKYKEAEREFQKALEMAGSSGQEPAIAEIREKAALGKLKTERAASEYIISEEDTLHISVWQNQDLDQDVVVRPDGKISFPLIGDIQASGLTLTELDREITERLREFVKYPEVSISIRKLGGKKVIILGEVADPGVYAVTGAKTILEAVGLAGGFTKDAVPSSVVVIRGGFQKPNAQRINLSRALKGDLRQNIPLHSEDIVFVPKKFIANLNYFLSQVLDPLSRGAYIAREAVSY